MEEKLKSHGGELRAEIQEKTLTYAIAAMGLVAGLAWNDAIKASIDFWFPLKENSLMAKFIYALAITVLVVIFTVYLMKILGKKPSDGGGNNNNK